MAVWHREMMYHNKHPSCLMLTPGHGTLYVHAECHAFIALLGGGGWSAKCLCDGMSHLVGP